jgi:hypothetical protein
MHCGARQGVKRANSEGCQKLVFTLFDLHIIVVIIISGKMAPPNVANNIRAR